jgi:hypothetical protein
MATTFLEPGGDADFLVGTTNGFWNVNTGPVVVATDFVHGSHIKSLKYTASASQYYVQKNNVLSDTGTRVSAYFYFNALPNATSNIIYFKDIAGSIVKFSLRITSGGILQLYNGNGATQIGTNGATLLTGHWYRISLAYTITSTTVNRFELFVDGISSISITNATLSGVGATGILIGNISPNTVLDFRSSDHYIDNSSSLTDPGNIWVTAKRPVANGTTNGFTTQIGSGGSGYGSGHSPQINERPLSTTNGWSMVGVGSAITEEYNIEAKNVGDIDISSATIIDWIGWASMKSLVGETAQIILDGSNVSQAIISTATLYTAIKGSSTYPSGSGADIGIITSTGLTTVSLYECGVIVAFTPPPSPTVYTMVTAPASFAYTPQSSTYPVTRNIPTSPASFTLTVMNSGFKRVMTMITVPASFIFTGLASTITVKIKQIYTIITSPAQFILTGQTSYVSKLQAAIKRYFGTDY